MKSNAVWKVLLALALIGWAGYNFHRYFSPKHTVRTRDAEMLSFHCAKCGATFPLPADALGGQYRDAPPGTPAGRANCPKCGAKFSATLAAPTAPPADRRRGS